MHAGHGGAWRFPLGATLALGAVVAVYLRGWLRLRRAAPEGPWTFRLAAFTGGMTVLWIALWSPLAGGDHQLLIRHMVQHLLLTTIAAPLVLLGNPASVLLRATTTRFVVHSPGRVFRRAALHVLFGFVTNPLLCWLAGTVTVVIWHVPAVFALAMHSPGWHALQRATFFASGLLFFWPVIQPWPSDARRPQWSVPLYLFLATLPCDALSAFLTFCGRTVYPGHGGSQDARLADQVSAGALMWFWVTIAYLIPAAFFLVRMLSPSRTQVVVPERALHSFRGLEQRK
jgi:putative membrane protein